MDKTIDLSKKCFYCLKSVKMMPFQCKCGHVFCSSHRLPEDHKCDFDYKTHERRLLTQANPVVKTDKVLNF